MYIKKFVAVGLIIGILLVCCSCQKSNIESPGANIGNQNISSSASQITSSTSDSQNSSSSGGQNQSSNSITSNSQDNSTSLTNKQNAIYYGVINGQDVLLDIYEDDNNLTAVYVFRNSKIENTMAGNIKNNTITLSQKGNGNKITGMLMADDSIKATCIINGITTQTLFKLKYAYYSGSVDERYPGYDTEQIESFAASIQQCVREDNKAGFSKLVAYPIKVNCNNKIVTIKSASDFEKNYNLIITPELKTELTSSYTKFLFGNSEGFMFGDNLINVWFIDTMGGDLKILAINNHK